MSDFATETAERIASYLNHPENQLTHLLSIEEQDIASIIREHCEERGWKERYEEASRQLDILRREVDKADLMAREINEIQTMVRCDHIEGLSRCVRERLEGRQ